MYIFKDYWGAIFKVFIEFVTILLLRYVLVFWPEGMWDLSPPDQGSNLHPLHCKEKSKPLDCQGSPQPVYSFVSVTVTFSRAPVTATLVQHDGH